MRKTSSTRTSGTFAGMLVLFARMALVLRRTTSKIFDSWHMFSAIGFVRDMKAVDDDYIHCSCGTQRDEFGVRNCQIAEGGWEETLRESCEWW